MPRADKEHKCSWLGTFQLDDIKPCSDIRSVEIGAVGGHGGGEMGGRGLERTWEGRDVLQP